MTPSEHPLSQLKFSTWVTSGARFNSEQRLRRQHAAQLWSIAALSAIAICLNILPLFTSPSDPTLFNNRCSFISTVISIAILSLSFYAANSSNIKHADLFHSCAKSIKSINKDICYIIEKNEEYEYSDIKKRYDSALEACPVNHMPCDYMLFCANNSNDNDIKKKHPSIKQEEKSHKRKYTAACYSPYILSAAFLFPVTVTAFLLPFSPNTKSGFDLTSILYWLSTNSSTLQ